jgi:serine/threonine protein phosphatase 1
MGRILAVGDIHGCAKTFRKLLLDGLKIRKSDTLYCIGDYIDRGPDSKGVIDFILELRGKGFKIRTLRGNHEQLMLDSIKGEEEEKQWVSNGGEETLESFGITSYRDMKLEYQDFFKKTRYYLVNGLYIFVHAGLNFGPEDPFEDRDAMLWIRNFVLDKQKLGDRIIIHGHTPKPLEEIVNPERDNVYNLDAGCVYKDRPGHGYLVALNLTDREWMAVKNCE